MQDNNQKQKPISKDEQKRILQEAMRNHYQKMETDEEYRKKAKEFQSKLLNLNSEN